ncbi:hypothetical protein ACFSQD_03570 [Flavihumibacter stibioxidans]|nr:hypothetical protein [Flavihumibacter stibioxidans]
MRYFILLFLTGSSVTLAAQITKPAMPGRKFEPAGKIYHQPPMIALPDLRLKDKSPVTGESMIRIFGKPVGGALLPTQCNNGKAQSKKIVSGFLS